MAAANRVGDPACTLAASGDPDPAMIPPGLDTVSIGRAGGYTCLIW
jgi:hypothetical protein